MLLDNFSRKAFCHHNGIVRAAAATVALVVMCAPITACGVKTTNESLEMAREMQREDESKPTLYKDELIEVLEIAGDDFDRYNFTDSPEMLEYYELARKSTSMISDTTVSQEDINLTVDKIRSARNRAFGVYDESDIDEYGTLPPYDVFMANVDQYVGCKYLVSGHITASETGVLTEKGDKSDKNIWVYVYWDESQTHGQIAALRIPYRRYNGIAGTWLKGKCVFESLDDRGNPQFEVLEYEVGHGE